MAKLNPCCPKCLVYNHSCVGVEMYSSEFEGQIFCFKKKSGKGEKYDHLLRRKRELRIAEGQAKQALDKKRYLKKEIRALKKNLK